ncbi:protein eva-1 homolog A isoform X1 [Phasianus colchicus]|uniref:protein eva-1 homolog A isoform X1 n=1 Tax=Phasianus colchicus TaxID=9054 RepID=UPI00129E9FB1|nr:protein eva-1 homolog A isoform X1 [Phasianus colchicus]
MLWEMTSNALVKSRYNTHCSPPIYSPSDDIIEGYQFGRAQFPLGESMLPTPDNLLLFQLIEEGIQNKLFHLSRDGENPERAALYFVSGVCIGLVLTLLALVLRVSCRTDCKRSSTKKPPRESDSDSSDSDGDSDSTSDVSARRHRRFERTLNMNVFTSAEELERAQRLEERERIIREIWMNGQPDIPGTRSLNRYY